MTEYLLLSPIFPRAVRFCLDRAARAVAAVADPALRGAERLDPPGRLLGRLRSGLAYLDVEDALGERLRPLLDELLRGVHQVGDEVTRTYFNTRVILPTAARGQSAPSSSSSSSNSRRRAHEAAHHPHHHVHLRRARRARRTWRCAWCRSTREASAASPSASPPTRRARCGRTWTASATACATSTPWPRTAPGRLHAQRGPHAGGVRRPRARPLVPRRVRLPGADRLRARHAARSRRWPAPARCPATGWPPRWR